MNGVDRFNQLRKDFSCHRPNEERYWRPMLWWLFDVCAINSFLIWRQFRSAKEADSCRQHGIFQDSLIDALLAIDPKLPIYDSPSNHVPTLTEKRLSCAYGVKYPGECLMGSDKPRHVLGEVKNEARPKRRTRTTRMACTGCKLHLCIDRDCFRKWHVLLHRNN